MASRHFTRPENAISKADEFMKVGKPTKALDTLYDVIKSKKRNHNYSEKLIEDIMYKYLELCVDLKKSHVAKEGLFQYRNMCQSVNVASLAAVVQGYLTMAEKRTDSAKQESVDKVEIDDLDILSTPEMIMLSAVSGEGAQDRSDRTILMPWVKFLWESYCQCLELLRTNSRVERLYHNIAQQAFKFCLKYQRKTEFRKLCDKLRNHLDLIIKQQNPTVNHINLNNSDTQQMNLDTRLGQLDAAIQMELWQEAYKAVEDIHGLMSLSKKVFQPKMMANYYQKLALVFWKSGNFLFHAAAVFKHFQLTREMKKNLSAEELAKMASRVLAACLCVPLPSQHPEFDRFIETDRSPAEKMARLAVLLALSQPPTRVSLLKDCVRFGVVTAASPELQDLYGWLEVDFHPLSLCNKMDHKLKLFEEDPEYASLAMYAPPLRDMTLVRLLKQVAQVYQTLTISRLLELAHFTDHHHMERLIVECARNNDMQVRIDHRTRSVRFGTDLTESQRTDLPEGPHVQSMPSEQIRTQLMRMMVSLDGAINTIHPDRNQVENAELRKQIVGAYHNSKNRDHLRLLARHDIIEKRKEWLETCNKEHQKEKMKQQEIREREKKKQEELRLKEEWEKREKRRKEEEIRDIQAKHTQDKIAQLKNTEFGKKVLDKMAEEEIAKMDADEIMARQVEELEKEKKELQVRLKAQEKKIDHMERAKRAEEIPLLREQHDVLKAERQQAWQEEEQERIVKEREQRENDVASKERLVRMTAEKEKYLEGLIKERRNVFEKKLKDFQALYSEEKAKRLEQRKEERKEERRTRWMREREEEQQRRRDEEAKKQREEEERLEAERLKREEEEYERKKKELDAIAEKTRQKERDMEEKLERDRREREEREKEQRASDRGGGSGFGRRGDDDRERGGEGGREGPWRSGGWRERERNREDAWGPRGDRRQDDNRRRDDDRRGGDRDEDGGSWRHGGGSPPARRRTPDRRGDDRRSPDRGGAMRRGADRDRRSPDPRDRRRGSPDRNRRRSPEDGGSWRSGGGSDRRSPDRRFGGSRDDRVGDRGFGRRDEPRRPAEDGWRSGGGGGFGRHGDRDDDRRGDRGGFGGDRDRDRSDRDRGDRDRGGFRRDRDDRGGDDGGSWRRNDEPRGPPPRRGDDGPSDRPSPSTNDDRSKPPQDEGWTKVKR